MAKFSNPTSFTAHFGVDPAVLQRSGAMDPLLNVDTKLFIDPLLLHNSSAPEVRSNGPSRMRVYFEKLMKLLQASRDRGALAAEQRLQLGRAHDSEPQRASNRARFRSNSAL